MTDTADLIAALRSIAAEASSPAGQEPPRRVLSRIRDIARTALQAVDCTQSDGARLVVQQERRP